VKRDDQSASSGSLTRVLSDWTRGLSFDAVLVIVAATILIILFHENGSSSVFRGNFLKYFSPSEFRDLYPAFYWYGCSLLLLGIVPFLIGRLVLGFPVAELGVGLGDWKFGLKAVFCMYFAFLPILVLVSYLPSFQSKYPLFFEAASNPAHFFVYECAYAVYFIGWEFIFRGFMLFGLRPSIGFYAVFVQMIPFAILHFGKAQIETLAAVLAGILLGYLALRARSFWYGWLLHTLVAVSNDVLAMLHKHW
jgi:uncharacterized protein